jgi:energy-coupling factor transporter ATP-binding protein EcfA2
VLLQSKSPGTGDAKGKYITRKGGVVQMKYKLNRGQALVLVGPQGCGKTTLAWNIAKAYGRAMEVEPFIFGSPFDLGSVLEAEPKVLIIEGLPESQSIMEKVKELLANSEVLCYRKGRQAQKVRTPHIIFCSGHTENMDGLDRRFCVVNLGGEL